MFSRFDKKTQESLIFDSMFFADKNRGRRQNVLKYMQVLLDIQQHNVFNVNTVIRFEKKRKMKVLSHFRVISC